MKELYFELLYFFFYSQKNYISLKYRYIEKSLMPRILLSWRGSKHTHRVERSNNKQSKIHINGIESFWSFF